MNLQENKGVIRVFLQILLSNLPRFQGFFRERCTLFQGRLYNVILLIPRVPLRSTRGCGLTAANAAVFSQPQSAALQGSSLMLAQN